MGIKTRITRALSEALEDAYVDGSKSDSLTKDRAVRALKGNPYVKVLPGA